MDIEELRVEMLKAKNDLQLHEAEMEKHIEILEDRIEKQEVNTKTIQDLVITVKELAINMKNMITVQNEQGIRLKSLEDKPAKKWDALVTTIVAAIASGGVGVIVGILFGGK